MRDDLASDDIVEHDLRKGGLSRRELGSLALGTGIAFALPRAAGAMETTESEVEIKTPDGTADAYFVHPASGRHPAVLIWPDIFGLRPAFRQMGKRLAESGYAVLVVNPFYRMKKAPTAPEKADFNDPETRKMLMALRRLAEPATSAHRCAGIRRLARRPGRRGQEAQDRHHRLLHGRPARHATPRRQCPIASAPAPRSTAAAS